MKNTKIIDFRTKSEEIDINMLPYKYAIPERHPIKLSDGSWLHIYRVTNYNDQNPQGDEDVEQEAFENEMY